MSNAVPTLIQKYGNYVVKFLRILTQPLSDIDKFINMYNLITGKYFTLYDVTFVKSDEFLTIKIDRDLVIFMYDGGLVIEIGDNLLQYVTLGILKESAKLITELLGTYNLSVKYIEVLAEKVTLGFDQLLTVNDVYNILGKDTCCIVETNKLVGKYGKLTNVTRSTVLNAFTTFRFTIRKSTVSEWLVIYLSDIVQGRVFINLGDGRFLVVAREGNEKYVDDIVKILDELGKVVHVNEVEFVNLILTYSE